MINVTEQEISPLSDQLEMPVEDFKQKYIETSQQGQMVINIIPCVFLKGSRCDVYENRFTECRGFPHLHKPNFKGRLFGTFMHYGKCPIIYNVIEQLKIETAFK